MNSNPCLGRIIHRAIKELAQLMRVLCILVLQEGLGPCRSIDVGLAHSSIFGNEIVDRGCLTYDRGWRWHCDPENGVPVLLDGLAANLLKESKESSRLEAVLGI